MADDVVARGGLGGDRLGPHRTIDVAAALREIAATLDALGENRFRARAYARAARALEEQPEALSRLVEEDRLTALPGIGEALSRVIAQLVTTGRSELLERLRAQVPAGVLELASVRGLSLERARALHEALGVSSVPELEAAARAGRVRVLRGWGERTEARLLESIARHHEAATQVRLVDVLDDARRWVALVARAPGVQEAALAGSLRRLEETATEVVIAARTGDARAAQEHLLASRRVARVEARAPDRLRVRLGSGLPLVLVTAPPEGWGAALALATGDAEHLAALAAAAGARGLSLDERGLTRVRSGAQVATPREEDLFAALGLPWLPPEVREGAAAVEAALAGDGFEDLVTGADIRGAVHCHTTWSDGVDSVEDMARAAEARGFEYLTITDHSRAASYAGGLTVERLAEQGREVAQVQARVRLRLLRGTECDILPDGALDFDDDVLAGLDVVIASIHARQRLDEDAMTRRLVRALAHPAFKVWGHPLGRLVLRRPPVALRMDEVLDAAARAAAAIEVNGDPYRLDLPPRWLRAARGRGLRFVVSLDAHSASGLDVLPFAVGLARRGWLRRGEVLNALPAPAFAAAVSPRRAAAHGLSP